MAAHQTRQARIGHHVRHMLVPRQKARIGQHRMRPVEHPQLHLFEGAHIVHELRPRRAPVGAAVGKAVLDHPLSEPLCLNRGGVLQAQQLLGRL